MLSVALVHGPRLYHCFHMMRNKQLRNYWRPDAHRIRILSLENLIQFRKDSVTLVLVNKRHYKEHRKQVHPYALLPYR